MHDDGKSTLASVSKWNSGKVNCSIVYFIYLLSKAAIELTELFSVSVNGHNWF